MKETSIRQSPFSLGTWVSTGSPVVAELATQYPLDWLLLDFEHGNTSEATLPEILRGISHRTASIIVRIPEFSPSAIGRALDWGADGIMMPHVRTADEAIRCVQAMRYPPTGHRGYSSSVRSYGYGTTPPGDLATVNPLFFAQIEDLSGIDNIDAIAAVDGVDVLFVGPADLKLALAAAVKPNKPTFEDALQQVAAAATKQGKQAGILLRDHAQLPVMRSLGYSCIAVDSDIALLRQGYERLMRDAGR
ncbi:HpcH/HpaI aldolase family protein [Parapedobacter pyrenivorans]|uniref:HpcH/HpaI aldolase family protein n=1 Tax=Parapedobacter pyrenivorans TaxID=1305674 RepID=UPI003342B41B